VDTPGACRAWHAQVRGWHIFVHCTSMVTWAEEIDGLHFTLPPWDILCCLLPLPLFSAMEGVKDIAPGAPYRTGVTREPALVAAPRKLRWARMPATPAALYSPARSPFDLLLSSAGELYGGRAARHLCCFSGRTSSFRDVYSGKSLPQYSDTRVALST